ncbi:MAG: GAF domain-containing protein [Sphingomonadaceae bacterium]
MEQFAIEAESKVELYRQLIAAADALTEGEPDPIANMANVAALLFETLPDISWAGFYRDLGGDPSTGSGQELVLGPFQGKSACIRIPYGKGVCGAAAARREAVRVDDVEEFPGHIVCDPAARSELVVPVMAGARLIAVLDLDSPRRARFDAGDEAGCLELARRLGPRLVAVEKR